jgi:hypothetical protein
MNQMMFLTSLFSRALTKANILSSVKTETEEGTKFNGASLEKYINWFLFKGGIRN